MQLKLFGRISDAIDDVATGDVIVVAESVLRDKSKSQSVYLEECQDTFRQGHYTVFVKYFFSRMHSAVLEKLSFYLKTF